MKRLGFRSIFVSDVHLGLADCQAGYLLDFLRSTHCERLYLVGDIIDLENMQKRPFWHADHSAVVAEVLAIATRGTRVVYIPGNHDAALRRLAGQRIAGIEIAIDAIHVGADGRRYRVSHGDEYDSVHAAPAWLLAVGDCLQGVVCSASRRCNAILRRIGLHYVPLSILVKQRIRRARHFIEAFQARVADGARARGLDGHICGHIHFGHIEDYDGVRYINDGDWVEHCTALVEHHDGALELLHWTGRCLSLARRDATQRSEIPLPAAA